MNWDVAKKIAITSKCSHVFHFTFFCVVDQTDPLAICECLLSNYICDSRDGLYIFSLQFGSMGCQLHAFTCLYFAKCSMQPC